jgi:hypothetical protein
LESALVGGNADHTKLSPPEDLPATI